ncbi:MAG: hypothetical protein ACJ75P_06315 [Gaiellaceae bacterium]
MKLAALSFFAVLLAVPLAARAASSPTYSVTLQATVRDEVSYTQQAAQPEDCTVSRTGSGGLALQIRSRATTTARALRGKLRLRVGGTMLAGAYSELRRCRFVPPERRRGSCSALPLPTFVANATFARVGRNRIAFMPGANAPAGRARLCGLTEATVLNGRLQRALASVNEAALRAGRARVVATGSLTRDLAGPAPNDPTVRLKEHITVRWRLIFTRR